MEVSAWAATSTTGIVKNTPKYYSSLSKIQFLFVFLISEKGKTERPVV